MTAHTNELGFIPTLLLIGLLIGYIICRCIGYMKQTSAEHELHESQPAHPVIEAPTDVIVTYIGNTDLRLVLRPQVCIVDRYGQVISNMN